MVIADLFVINSGRYAKNIKKQIKGSIKSGSCNIVIRGLVTEIPTTFPNLSFKSKRLC